MTRPLCVLSSRSEVHSDGRRERLAVVLVRGDEVLHRPGPALPDWDLSRSSHARSGRRWRELSPRRADQPAGDPGALKQGGGRPCLAALSARSSGSRLVLPAGPPSPILPPDLVGYRRQKALLSQLLPKQGRQDSNLQPPVLEPSLIRGQRQRRLSGRPVCLTRQPQPPPRKWDQVGTKAARAAAVA